MYLRAKYTKYKMAKTKFSIWRYIICEICKKNGSNRPFLASRVADTIFPPPIEGHHRQLDNQCKDPMDNNKDCRVGQLTTSSCFCILCHALLASSAPPPPLAPVACSRVATWRKRSLLLLCLGNIFHMELLCRFLRLFVSFSILKAVFWKMLFEH